MRRDLMMPGVVRAFGADRAGAERAGMWFKAALLGEKAAASWLEAKAPAHHRALNEGTNTAGGYLVPAEVADRVFAILPLVGVFYGAATVRPMTRDRMSLPKRSSGFSLSFTTEGVAGAEGEAAFGAVNFNAQAAAGIGRVSVEMFGDAAALGEFLVMEFAFALGDLMDRVGFNGTGSAADGGMTGITTRINDGTHAASLKTAASNHDEFAELDAADLSDVMSILPEAHWENAAWYCSGFAVAKTFARLGMGAGGTVMTVNGPRPMLHYLGFPIKVTGRMPGSGDQSGVPMLLFGDLSMAASVGERRRLVVSLSKERYWGERQIAFMVDPRFDIVVHDLGDDSAAGPVVALLGN
ncbi:MAG: phage major capsid protein [Dongiaceae bacterium]